MKIVLAAICLMACTTSAFAGPSVYAPVTPQDVQAICALVSTVTKEPVLSLDPVHSKENVPGSIAQSGWTEYSATGGRTETLYERTDCVDVRTGDNRKLTGGEYRVEKKDGVWKVISTGSWIH